MPFLRKMKLVLTTDLSRLYNSPGMRHAGCQAHEHRNIIDLGIVERLARHVVGFLLVGRLEARHHGEIGVESGILFILGGMLRRVIAGHDHKAAVGTGDSRIDESVGADIHAHMLHADEGAFPRI